MVVSGRGYTLWYTVGGSNNNNDNTGTRCVCLRLLFSNIIGVVINWNDIIFSFGLLVMMYGTAEATVKNKGYKTAFQTLTRAGLLVLSSTYIFVSFGQAVMIRQYIGQVRTQNIFTGRGDYRPLSTLDPYLTPGCFTLVLHNADPCQ